MKTTVFFSLFVTLLFFTVVSCDHKFPFSGSALQTAYVEITGDTGKTVTVRYNSLDHGEGENREVTEELTLPASFTINLAINGKTTHEGDLCYLQLNSDGHTNVRAILISESAGFANECPIAAAFYPDSNGDLPGCDKYILGTDSLITLLKERGYPCIIELGEGDTQAYTSTSEISNTGAY